MDIQLILGYINYFVEKYGYKVILIADGPKLIDLNNQVSKPNINYERIKEKLIGKTAEVEGVLDELPGSSDDELWPKTCSEIYMHVYEKYPGQGESVYV